MATLRLKEFRSDYLYEFAWSNAIDTWFSIDPTSDGQYIELPVDGTNRIVVRVTSNQAEFGAKAYLIQRGVFSPAIPGTLWQDYKYIQLNVADGSGTFRADSYANNYSDPAHALVESGSIIDLQAFNQQVDLERQIGVVFDYNGTKLRGTTTSRTDSKNLEPGGYLESFDVVLTTSREQWVKAGTNPILGASVTVAGVKYRIATIVINGGHFELALSKHRGS